MNGNDEFVRSLGKRKTKGENSAAKGESSKCPISAKLVTRRQRRKIVAKASGAQYDLCISM